EGVNVRAAAEVGLGGDLEDADIDAGAGTDEAAATAAADRQRLGEIDGGDVDRLRTIGAGKRVDLGAAGDERLRADVEQIDVDAAGDPHEAAADADGQTEDVLDGGCLDGQAVEAALRLEASVDYVAVVNAVEPGRMRAGI